MTNYAVNVPCKRHHQICLPIQPNFFTFLDTKTFIPYSDIFKFPQVFKSVVLFYVAKNNRQF